MGAQSRSKPVMKALPRRDGIRSAFWRDYGTSQKRILKAFLKSPVDEMMCLRQKNGKVRIFKNTCVFTVRLHIDVVEDSRGLTGKSMNLELGSWKPSRSVFGLLWNLDLDTFWARKIVPNRVEHHVN